MLDAPALVIQTWSNFARSERPMRPNPAVNTDAHRRGFARAVVAGYLDRWASNSCAERFRPESVVALT